MLHPFLSRWAVTRRWCWTSTVAISVHMSSHEISAHCGIKMEPCPVCHQSTRGKAAGQGIYLCPGTVGVT